MKPLLLFDGTCGFCCFWIRRWKRITGDQVAYAPFQQAAQDYPQISRSALQEAVHLVRPDGSVATGARAVFETLGWQRFYNSIPGLGWLSEAVYRLVARHRPLLYRLTRFFLREPAGKEVNPCERL